MAATVEARRLSEAHRLAQARLGVSTARQVMAAWPLLDLLDLDGSFDRWLLVVARLTQAQRRASSSLAASYLTAFRTLELGVSVDEFTPIVAPPVEARRLAESMLSSGPAVVKNARRRSVPLAKASEFGKVASARASMRHALNGGRETVTESVKADTKALGWARTTSGRSCAFCSMLASRGPVYKSEETAALDVHDGCSCGVEPTYRRDSDWPPGSRGYREMWDQAQAEARASGDLKRDTTNDALNAFRRALARQ